MSDNNTKSGEESLIAAAGAAAGAAAVGALVKALVGNNPHDGATVGFGTLVEACMSAAAAAKTTNFDPASQGSLFSFTKSTQISSSVYIQKELAQEEILGDVLNCAQQLYISLVLSAVSLNTIIEGTNTKVKDALKVVATEQLLSSLNQEYTPTNELLGGIESFGAFTKHGKDMPKLDLSGPKMDARILKEHGALSEVKLPVGRIVELSFGPNAKVNVMVNLYPQFIPYEVMQEFFRIGRSRALSERWFKYRIGEISFWSFLFELYAREEKRAALKKDKTGILYDMLEKQRSGLSKWFFKQATGAYRRAGGSRAATHGEENRQNIVNSIIVLTKSDFEKWCKDTHQDFRRVDTRNDFMFKTMSMMVIVIDPDYQMVEMYYHGIQNKGEFTYKMIQNQAKNERTDIMTLMQAFSNTHSPRF